MTTNLTPLTAADLVVGQSYLVPLTDTGYPWMLMTLESLTPEWATFFYFGQDRMLGRRVIGAGGDVACILTGSAQPLQTFPDPPAGRKWHNPEGLTPEQVGVAEGWRLCLEEEICDFPHQFRGGSKWLEADVSTVPFKGMALSYRTKHSLPLNATIETPADREALAAHNWSMLQRENAGLKTRIAELEEEVRRKSWRPVSEKPEEGDLDGDRCVLSVREREDGSIYTTYLFADHWPWEGTEPKVLFWKPDDVPGLTEDQKFAQWKAAASEEDRDAAMLAGWKAKGGVA